MCPIPATPLPATPRAAELTIDRLFEAPALAGPTLLGLRVSPDGTRVTFLRGKPDQKDRLDLWEYDIQEDRVRLLVDSALFAPSHETLSAEEAARRERQRTAAYSGILEYSFAPSGKALLFPIAGKLLHLALAGSTHADPVEIAPGGGFVTDAVVSPAGGHVAYVRDQNLFVYDIETCVEIALTSDGGDTVKNGMAEFVAQEEMDRHEGYWWAPDGHHIAFARVNESAVAPVQRFTIDADDVTTFTERYPLAGQANVSIRIGVTDLQGAVTWMDLGTDPDIYIARVAWLPDGKTVAVQRQSRDQRRLDLLLADAATGRSRVILTETSDTWIDLHNELTFLARSRQFVWLSARTGYPHLYLHDYEGRLIRPITSGDWCVDDFRHRAIKGVDEKNRIVYFTATEKSPTERHLYRTSLDTENPNQVDRISQESGLHSIAMSTNTEFYVDTFNSASQPPRVTLRTVEGTVKAVLVDNRLDADHPAAGYLHENSAGEIGTLMAADGQTLHYRLFRPVGFDATKRYPAIVEVYGGPGVQRVLDNWAGATFTQILMRAGFVVFQLDNRGTAHRGVSFQAPIKHALGEIEVADQVLGARWLASQTYVDSNRIGVWGWSYGGYMTLMLMFKAPELFRAGASGAPVTDWALYDTHYTERYLGRPDENRSGYDASSVFNYAHTLRGSLLLLHGMADDNVFFSNSTKLYRRLQALRKPFDVMVYPGAKHGLLRQDDGRHAYRTILDFFTARLRN